MPRHSGLLRRQGRYYLNVRIPTDLRTIYGKQDIIRKALGTSDHREAISRIRFESFKLDSEFAEKRRQLKTSAEAALPRPQVCDISNREAHEIVTRFFVGLENLSEEWWENDGCKLAPEKLNDALDALRTDSAVYAGGGEALLPEDGSADLDAFLKTEGLDIPKDSAAYRKLRPLFRRARLENVQRTIDRATNRTVQAREPLLREVFAHTPAPPARSRVTLGEMLAQYFKFLTDAGRTQGTHRTYELPARLLREVLGKNTALDSITKNDIERLFDLLKRAPANATTVYPGMTLEEAISAADKRGDARRLGNKTLENYYNNITAIFNFAVTKKLIAENPAKDRYFRATFTRGDEDTEEPRTFEIEELNRLFRAPLYTGCRDDGSGYAKPGSNHPRRGRFWVPLLSLYHGFRCNEAAQLYTEDVREEEGIPYFEIREERKDGSKCDKRLKTRQSKRRVPIHPEILRMGFLDFVKERRRDTSHPRLFPDLPCGASGYFSDPFSKWFGRFLKTTLGDKCEATFHSFRHMLRDALTEAGVPIPDVERIGGWELMQRSAERQYGRGPSLRRLREQLEKVQYPGLNLSHLYHYPKLSACNQVASNLLPSITLGA